MYLKAQAKLSLEKRKASLKFSENLVGILLIVEDYFECRFDIQCKIKETQL